MTNLTDQSVLVVGAGAGLSASLARLFTSRGGSVVLAARNVEKLEPLRRELSASLVACDVSSATDVEKLFVKCDDLVGTPDLVVYNPSYRTRGDLIDLDPEQVQLSLQVTAFGGFLVAQQATRRMLEKRSGAIFFTGASASVKGYAKSAPFAMGKFALRGLAQSMARELQPANIHIAHFVIDGGIRGPHHSAPVDNVDSLLDPDAIAQSYLDVYLQSRTAWSLEVELRPWTEKF